MRRENRLKRGADFDRVFREGIAAGGPFFVVRAVPNDVGHPRWGLAVGRKALPNATDRNRVRRRLRAAADVSGVSAHADIVVVGRRHVLGARFEELRSELKRLCAKLGLR